MLWNVSFVKKIERLAKLLSQFATTQLLAIEKVRAECKRRFGKTVLLQTEIKEKLF